MLFALFLFLVILWAVGMFTATTMGGLIHLLLVVAVVAMLVHFLRGRRAV